MRESAATRFEYLLAALIVAVATGVGVLFRAHLGIIDVAMIYLLAVVVAGSQVRSGPAFLTAALSVAALDFFFVPPYYTFNVHDSRYYLTFVVMLVVALAMSRLTTLIRQQAEDAMANERLTAALYAFNQEIAGVETRDRLLAVAASHLSRAAGAPADIVLADRLPRDDQGLPDWSAGAGFDNLDARLTASRAYQTGEAIGWGSARYPDADALAVPLSSGTGKLGVAMIRREAPDQSLDEQARRTVEALGGRIGLALVRAEAAERHEAARVELETERLRTELLSSLSHDLRTPLSTIEGAASSLVQDDGATAPAGRLELAETILEESRRMHRMVGNLLDMVRVEGGMLAVHQTWQPLEEVVGVALSRVDDRLANHPVTIRLDPALPLVPIDEILIEQVFINLLENAIKHTAPGTPITIAAKVAGDAVEVEVSDQGAGIPPGQEEAVFERFYRITSAETATGGAGLGLTICRGIVAAHGGRIWVDPGATPGTTVRFTLPLGSVPPPDVVEAPT